MTSCLHCWRPKRLSGCTCIHRWRKYNLYLLPITPHKRCWGTSLAIKSRRLLYFVFHWLSLKVLLITVLETCKALGKSHCSLHPRHNYQQLKGKRESPKQIMNACWLWGFKLGLGVGLGRSWRLWTGGVACLVVSRKMLPWLPYSSLPLAPSPRVTVQLDSIYFVLQTAFWPGNKVFTSLQMVPSKHVEQCFILRTVFVPSRIQVRRVCANLYDSFYELQKVMNHWQLIA